MFNEFVLTLRWIGDLMCMLISVCFCASVNASMTQLGGCSKSRRILRIKGATQVPIRSLVRGVNCCSLTIRLDYFYVDQ